MLRKCIKRIRNSPRVHNIIDKTAMVLTWTPIVLIVYIQAGLLTYRYSREDDRASSILD
jgi:hypothetical protein